MDKVLEKQYYPYLIIIITMLVVESSRILIQLKKRMIPKENSKINIRIINFNHINMQIKIIKIRITIKNKFIHVIMMGRQKNLI